MKLQKYTKTSISIIFTLLLSYGLVSAWTNLSSVNTGDQLTATVWNDMATKLNETGIKVSEIFTDGSGRVGIGTNSPNSKLEVRYDGNTSLGSGIGGLIRVVNEGGLLGDYPQITFKADGVDRGSIWLNPTVNTGYAGASSFNFGSSDIINLGLVTSNTTRIFVGSNGNIGIGTNSPGYKLTVNGQPAANGYTAFTNYSDKRLKENIETLSGGVLDKVLKLNPVTYQYNDKYYEVTGYDKTTKEKEYNGFIAQELQKIFPDMVNKKGEYLDTDLSSLQIYILKAVQELEKEKNTQIKELKKENKELLKRVEKLEKNINNK